MIFGALRGGSPYSRLSVGFQKCAPDRLHSLQHVRIGADVTSGNAVLLKGSKSRSKASVAAKGV